MNRQPSLSRRSFLGTAAALGLAGGGTSLSGADRIVRHGRIRQSVMGWCFRPLPVTDLARHCRDIGLVAMEGIGREHYPAIRELGLAISLVGSHGFARGPVNRENHDHCRRRLLEAVDLADAIGTRNVITFTGMSERGIAPEAGARNCVALWKSVMAHAESRGVRLCLEHLNSRDDSHPMKGHPGYFGDDVDLCVDLIRKVDSPSMKLLFDIYHVQVMHGDVIRRIRQYHEYIGHYHTAGNPGRGELDEDQEIHYPAVLRAVLRTGYEGYVAQEFIPTWDDPLEALDHAARVCDVTLQAGIRDAVPPASPGGRAGRR